MSDDRVHGRSTNGIKPALGLAWADMVTVRLMLTRPEAVETEADYQQVHKLHVCLFQMISWFVRIRCVTMS